MTEAGVLTAKPVVMARIGYACAVFVLVVFIVVALVMRTDNAGASFVESDQVATGLIGLILAGLCLMPTRPRLRADADGVRLRSFLGGWRSVPWDVIVRIDFPSNVRFARLVLPGEETLAIYAIARVDKQRAVAAMRELRALYAAVKTRVSLRPGPRDRRGRGGGSGDRVPAVPAARPRHPGRPGDVRDAAHRQPRGARPAGGAEQGGGRARRAATCERCWVPRPSR